MLSKIKYDEFRRFFDKLVAYSMRFNLSREDVKDIVSDSIIKALEFHDQSRGSFESLCLVIIKNKIIDFKRDNRFLFLLILIDENEDIVEADTITIEDKEKNIMALKFIKELKNNLDEDELKLFDALYELCESGEKPNVSKASRQIGIDTSKGWNVFRKIQRKAISESDIMDLDEMKDYNLIYSEFAEERSQPGIDLFVSSKSIEIKTDQIFIKFIDSLSADNISKLEMIYKD